MNRSQSASDLLLQQSGYTYFAFISYRRTDSRWAAWLKRRLQSYRLPQRTHRNHRDLPLRFSSVFLDKTNLTPGLLDEGLRAEVQASKYLIVICSRSAKEKSQYLDDEIQYFLDGGGDPSRIIPFIVDNAPRPEEECFPRRLRELCQNQTILGANIHDSGKRNAFLKVIAYMHGLKLEEIESDDTRRRRKKTLIASLAGAAFLALAAVGGYFCWDYYAPKTAYYLDYTERYGIPEGIHELTEEEMLSTAKHYAIVSSRRKVRELRYENAYGQLKAHNGAADYDRPIRAAYEYSENDTLEKVTWYNTSGDLVLVMNYANLQTADLQYESADSYVGSTFLRADNSLDSNESGGLQLQNVSRYLLDYDENGFLSELRYVSNPAYNNVAADQDGICGMRYERDETGRVIRLWYLGYTGERGSARFSEDYEIIGMSNGVAGMSYTYNEQDELTEYTYLDSAGKSIRNSQRFSLVKIRYDDHHNSIETSYYDTAGNPVIKTGGFAVYTVEYDARGNRTGAHFYGTNGEPVLNSDGYASMVTSCDLFGNIHHAEYFGTNGEPVTISEGYAVLEYEFGADSRILSERCYDTEGNPVLCSDGYAIQTWEYDDLGRITGTAYFGADRKPCTANRGFSESHLEYDAQGRVYKVSCFDTNSAPCICADGFSSFTKEYDETGNVNAFRFYGTDGKPFEITDGYAAMLCTYDERGNEISERYYDAAGNPVLSSDGYASVEYEYDDSGRASQVKYLGTDAKLILLPDQYAMIRQNFDRRGNCVEIYYYDTDEKFCLNLDGYAILRNRYDDRGRLVQTDYYGTDGAPILRSGGYASSRYSFDSNGQVTDFTFLGMDGMPIVSESGAAIIHYEYDISGNRTLMALLDPEGKPIATESGLSFCRYYFDENGHQIRIEFYDTEGSLIGSYDEP